jgi:DNA-binding transcriptional regulator YhcF (GntR family)
MNESRQQQILAGQSSIAQKVFSYVPIQTSWSNHEIHSAVSTAKATGASPYAIRRALGELKEAGLIREPVGGKFQRDAATPKPKKEPVMTQATKSTVVSIKKSEGALDVLASLSGEVVSLADDFSKRMKALAARIEEVALSVEAERETNAAAVGKLKQLQELLKGISQ